MADDNECSARAVRLDRKVERNGGETQLCSILGDMSYGDVSTASALSSSGWIWLQIVLSLIELHVGGRGGCELTCR